MKQFLLLLLLPLLAIALNSCTMDGIGDDDTYDWPKYDKLVKSTRMISWYDGGLVEYQYDNQKRLIKMIKSRYPNDSDARTTTISYSKDKITTHFQSYTDEYILDNDGYLTKVIMDEGAGRKRTILYTYANGYLARSSCAEEGWSISYVWSNGNLIEEKYSNGRSYVYTYTNYPDDLSLSIIEPRFDIPLKFKGAHNKNLHATMVETTINSIQETFAYSYTFDADGYPTTIKHGWGEGGYVTVTTYIAYY